MPDDDPKLSRPGKDTQLRDAQEARIKAAEERAKKAEGDEDAATKEALDAWKWTANAWRYTFVGSWAIAAIGAALVLGVNYLDLNIPYIGHLKLSRDATSAGEEAAEEHNAVEEVLDAPAEEVP